MNNRDRIIDELTRALERDPWYGPAISEVLEGVDATAAAARPIAGAHSIWELVHRVTAWVRAIHTRLKGSVCELAGEADWPPVREPSERAWTAAVDDLRRAQAELVATLRSLGDADLGATTPNRDYDLEYLLRGLTQHHAYHTGQMAIIKNAGRKRT